MPISTTCPNCQRPLRVPDNLIGKAVKCPGCATTWTVESPEAPIEAEMRPPGALPPSPEPPPPVDAHRAADAIRESPSAPMEANAPTEEHIRETPGGAPVPPPPPPAERGDVDDDDDEEFERDLDRRQYRRGGKRLVADAKKKLLGPSIGLFVVSGLLFLDALFRIASTGFGLSTMATTPGMPAAVYAMQGFMFVYAVWLLAAGGVTLYGGLKMMKVRSFAWAMAACITGMIPNCECCFLVGLPFGIWGIVMLSQPDVKRAFRQNYQRPPADSEPPDDSAVNEEV